MFRLFPAAFSFCLFFGALSANGQPRHSPAVIDTAAIDHLLDSASKKYAFNGVALLAQDGQVIIEKGYGWKNIKSNTLHDTASIFQTGSITKAFTAAVILKLQEQGKLSVSDPLAKFLPGYPNGDKITLHHLLTHTSGIYDYTQSLAPYKFIIKKTADRKSILNIFRDKPLAFEPGSGFSYSSSGYYLLGMVIEQVTGKPYEQVVREMIFRPLGMSHSGFDFRGLKSASRSTGYSVFYRERQSVAFDMDSTVLYAAGGIYSTAGDLFRWTEAFSGPKFLSAASRQQALSPYRSNYAFGWAVDSLFGKKFIAHGGLTANFSSYILHFVDEDITLILLSNTAGNLWDLCVKTSQLVFGQPYPWGSRPEAEPGKEVLDQFAGTYSNSDKLSFFISLKDGRLHLNGSPATRVSDDPLVSLGGSRFYSRRFNLEICFVKDAEGKVTGLRSRREGLSLDWKKLEQ
ncbi:serine hydrolase [Flavihumibacter sp. R14]|nr:serine hydrolase [Flavihumibacter soli]